jgi:hypothetical protein
MMTCCSKVICQGCDDANAKRENKEGLVLCPFCRQPLPSTREEGFKKKMRRINANDPVAIRQVGTQYGSKGDYVTALKYLTKAAELGDAAAHHSLASMYHHGHGVEKDQKKKIYHWEEAAIGGHPLARSCLGSDEWENGTIERAVKHWIIAANLGCDNSIKFLKKCYASGAVTKEDFAAALRAHHTAVDAMRSPLREAAKKKKQQCGVKTFE